MGAGLNLRTLEHTPPEGPSNVSIATYFDVRRQQQAGVEITPARYSVPEVNMGQTPDPGAYGHVYLRDTIMTWVYPTEGMCTRTSENRHTRRTTTKARAATFRWKGALPRPWLWTHSGENNLFDMSGSQSVHVASCGRMISRLMS